MKLLILLPLLLLSACCTLMPSKCEQKVREICTPTEPIIQTEYVVLPEYLVAPCQRPIPFPLDILDKEFDRLLDKRKGDHNMCADRMDSVRIQNDKLKEANKLEADEAKSKLGHE